MAKQTLVFTSAVNLSVKNDQLLIVYEDDEGHPVYRAFEEIKMVMIDNHSVHITIPLLLKLEEYNIAVVICDSRHYPKTMMMDLVSNATQTKSFRKQIEANEPMKKKMWKQIVEAKIKNQMLLLKKTGLRHTLLQKYHANVKSGDTTNREAAAANVYWDEMFGRHFIRDRYGEAPNNLLNYGYSLLRAYTARALMNSGLLPTIGIFHRNYYDSYPLADDVMEPYRPMVDEVVSTMFKNGITEIGKQAKCELIGIFHNSISFDDLRTTTASLASVFAG